MNRELGINIKARPHIFADVLGVPMVISTTNEVALAGVR